MKKFLILSACIPLVLIGCAKTPAMSKANPVDTRQKANLDPNKKLSKKTFGDLVVNFQVEVLSKKYVKLTLDYLDPSQPAALATPAPNANSANGAPLPATKQDILRGTLVNGASSLISSDNQQIVANLSCVDGDDCNNYHIEVQLTTQYGVGSAIIDVSQSIVKDLQPVYNPQITKSHHGQLQLSLSDSLQTDPYEATFTLGQVTNGKKAFYQLNIVYENTKRTKPDDATFDSKQTMISGEVGADIKTEVVQQYKLDSKTRIGRTNVQMTTVLHKSLNLFSLGFGIDQEVSSLQIEL